MPYKKRKTRKRSAWARKRSIARQPRAAIADSQLVHLRYSGEATIDPGLGTSATHVLRANDCFDPDRTGVGHQPLGFDEWGTFYDHITVIGSKVTCWFIPLGEGATTDTALCSITVEDDANVSTSVDSVMERTGAVYGYMGGGDGKGALKLTKKFSTKKFFGVTDVKDVDALKGSFSASPADDAYFHLNVSAPTSSYNISAVAVRFLVEYVCVLTERKNLVQS